jgi:hypothetical protein
MTFPDEELPDVAEAAHAEAGEAKKAGVSSPLRRWSGRPSSPPPAAVRRRSVSFFTTRRADRNYPETPLESVTRGL